MKRLIKRLAKFISLEITVKRRDVHSQIMTENDHDVSPYLVLDRRALKRPLDEDSSRSSGTYLPNKSVIYIGECPFSAKVNN